MKHIMFAALCLMGLAACTTGQTNSAFVAAESSDTLALAALIVYEKAPTKSEPVIQKILEDQKLFDEAAAPAEAEVAAGQPVTNMAAITGALALITADELSNGINPNGSS
jgi:hypothetical protein